MVDTRRMLTGSRRRVTSAILTHCEESSWYRQLTGQQREALRSKVLDAVGVYHDNVLDVIRALEGDPNPDGVTNERALELLESIWFHVQPVPRGETQPPGPQAGVNQQQPFLAPASGG